MFFLPRWKWQTKDKYGALTNSLKAVWSNNAYKYVVIISSFSFVYLQFSALTTVVFYSFHDTKITCIKRVVSIIGILLKWTMFTNNEVTFCYFCHFLPAHLQEEASKTKSLSTYTPVKQLASTVVEIYKLFGLHVQVKLRKVQINARECSPNLAEDHLLA